MSVITITREAPDSPDGRALVGELDDALNPLYAPEDRHGYDLTRLLQPGVRFFIVRVDGEAAGCGAVHLFEETAGDVAYGEVKRMFVRPGFRGLGLGRRILEHLAGVVGESGRSVVRLETGIHQREAIRLYETAGFMRIPRSARIAKPTSASATRGCWGRAIRRVRPFGPGRAAASAASSTASSPRRAS